MRAAVPGAYPNVAAGRSDHPHERQSVATSSNGVPYHHWQGDESGRQADEANPLTGDQAKKDKTEDHVCPELDRNSPERFRSVVWSNVEGVADQPLRGLKDWIVL